MAAGVANQGNIVANRYVLKVHNSVQGVKGSTKLTNDPQFANIVKDLMIKQSAPKVYTLGIAVGGKTGTPERIWKRERINDGWYVFFAPKAKGKGHMVVCVRIEATKGSSDAVALAGKHIIPLLMQKGYIKSFASAQPLPVQGIPGQAVPGGPIVSPTPVDAPLPADAPGTDAPAAAGDTPANGG
jgi:cell division protein FtsI/penicillin-binding protein 2